MSSDSQGSSAVETAATGQPQELGPLQVQLVNWPLRDHPKRSVCLILIMTLTSLLAGMMAESF
ncbi:MAG: hypothetical protein VB857_02420, partial [Pirellulaceae bacterium]